MPLPAQRAFNRLASTNKSKLILNLSLALGLAMLSLWFASLGSAGALEWLNQASPRTIKLLASWSWVGALLAAVPALVRARNAKNPKEQPEPSGLTA
ncbi:MAG: hypothetical protein QM788_01840 [Roseateles sp.]|uniref:hypothetical protein n=1 Tax=Roseateles sp. TaxID=1971397 RepID=UPI0039EB9256